MIAELVSACSSVHNQATTIMIREPSPLIIARSSHPGGVGGRSAVLRARAQIGRLLVERAPSTLLIGYRVGLEPRLAFL